MSRPISPEQEALYARIAEAREKIAALEAKQRALDSELQGMSAQREQFQLLDQICESLDKLDQMGASSLFWGEQQPGQEVVAHLTRARSTAAAFVQKIAVLEQDLAAARAGVEQEEWNIVDFETEIGHLQAREEARANEFVVYREVGEAAYRTMIMPWSGDPEDEKRFRKALLISIAIVLLSAFITRIWRFPPPEEQVVEIPKSLVKLVQKQEPKPPEPPRPQEEEKPKETAKATPKEKEQARAKAVKSGVLAFKSGFADLLKDSVSLKLGSDSQVSTSGSRAVGGDTRNIVAVQATGGSGGISTSSLSRDVGGGGGKQITGVAFTRVESGVAGMQAASDRPLSSGPGPSRTDEEIQIVFDKYKAALYRIYQRELRNDPSLRGKMILKITIEPNGSVSACAVQSSDLGSATLKTEIVARVKKFNFGAKAGVSKITILYPIDFLPAS